MLYTVLCEKLLFPDTAHEYLAEALELPAHYGRNLDALYDCLTERGPCTIVLVGAEALRQWGGPGAKILSVIEQAAGDNPHLELEYNDEAGPEDEEG